MYKLKVSYLYCQYKSYYKLLFTMQKQTFVSLDTCIKDHGKRMNFLSQEVFSRAQVGTPCNSTDSIS
jgi:hypothetical protein